METKVSINRQSEIYARGIFEEFYENKTIRIACAKLLADSISLAHQVSSSCWSLTLFTDKIRLNVGPVEVLVLSPDEVYLVLYDPQDGNFVEGAVDSYIGASAIHYSSVPVNHFLCHLPPAKISELYPLIADSHQQFIRKSAERRKKTSWINSFSPGVIRYLNALLQTNLSMPSYYSHIDDEALFPDQISTDKTHFEGAPNNVPVNRYERDKEAREICIHYYGLSCYVCNFNFKKVYGTPGDNFIHVHHLLPLSEINERHQVNPITDLRPVCPNCHVMIHRREPPYTIEEVRLMLAKVK
jgi:5-methylcytosine-specific restriction protein A